MIYEVEASTLGGSWIVRCWLQKDLIHMCFLTQYLPCRPRTDPAGGVTTEGESGLWYSGGHRCSKVMTDRHTGSGLNLLQLYFFFSKIFLY